MKNLKRTLCSLLAIILLAGVYVPCAGLDFGAVKAEAAALYTGIVTSSGPLNVRSGPSSTSKIITTLNQGTTVKITEVSGDFYKIDIRVSAYTYGYISKNYVKLIKEEGGGTKTGTVSSSGALNVRAKASTTATKIGTLNRGASVTILAAEGDFYKIEFRSGSYTYGYVYKSYITVASTPAQTTISGTVKTSSGGGVNVRSLPSTSGKIIGQLKNGAKVTIIDTYGTYYKIKVSMSGYTVGYISTSYVSVSAITTKPTTTTTTTPTTKGTTAPQQYATAGKVTTTGAALNVRKAASSTSSILTTLKNGTAVTILATTGEYFQIALPSGTGYILRSYVTVTESSSTSVTSTTTTTTAPAKAPVIAQSTFAGTVKISSGSAIVRKTASSTGTKVGTLANGASVSVIGASGSFYKIKTAELEGFISMSNVSLGKPTNPSATGKINITTGTLNVRKLPSTSAAIIGTIKANTAVKIIGCIGDFYVLEYAVDGRNIVFVAKTYVAVDPTTTTTTTTTTPTTSSTTTTTSETTTTTTTAPVISDSIGSVNIGSGLLNVRKSASASAEVITTIPKGTTVIITGVNGDFYQIKVSVGKYTSGYVSKNYITIVKKNSTKELSQITTGVVVTEGSALNVRSEANSSSAKVSTVNNGATVYIIEKLDGWYKIQTEAGAVGYVASKYIPKLITSDSTSLRFASSYFTAKVGTPMQLTVLQAGLPVKYSSSNTNVAKIDANGNLTFVSNGLATISASCSPYGSASCTLIVMPKTRNTVTKTMSVSDSLVSFIAAYEGGMSSDGRFYKYYDKTGKVYTIGYGHVIRSGEKFSSKGLSKSEALALLKKDIKNSFEGPVNDFAKREGIVLTQYQFDALVSFAYNLGPSYFSAGRSMFYLKAALVSYGNGSKIPAGYIYDGFSRYYKSGSYNLSGLYRRRMDEAEMFVEGNYTRDYAAKWPLPAGIKWS